MLDETGHQGKEIIRHCKIYDYEGNKKYWEDYNKRLCKDLEVLDWVWSEEENRWVYREDIEDY